VNVRVSTYWFWFVVWFGVGCLLPVLPLQTRSGAIRAILAYIYTAAGHREGWETILLMHTVSAGVLGVLSAFGQHLRGRRQGLDRHRIETAFSLRYVLIAVAVLAVVFGALRWVEAPPVSFLCVLIAWAGQPLTGIVVGWCPRPSAKADILVEGSPRDQQTP